MFLKEFGQGKFKLSDLIPTVILNCLKNSLPVLRFVKQCFYIELKVGRVNTKQIVKFLSLKLGVDFSLR